MALTKVTGQVIKNTTDVTVGVLTVTNTLAVGGTVSIGGTLTYEDVTNVDAVGLITARNGIVVGSGITLSKDGDVFFTGIATGNGSGLTALNASNISSGTVPTARLGSGTASSSTFLRGDSTFQTVNTDLVSDTSPQLGGDLQSNGNDIDIADNDRIYIGTDNDTQIYDNNVSTYIDSNLHKLRLQVGDSRQVLLEHRTDGDYMAIFTDGGSCDLYHAGSLKFETTASGTRTTGAVHINDGSTTGNRISVGNGGDLKIYHTNPNSYIDDGSLALSISSQRIDLSSDDGENMARFYKDAQVELYHNAIKKFDTISTGIRVHGSEGGDAQIQLLADEGDDNADYWRFVGGSGGGLDIASYSSGSWVNHISVNPDGEVQKPNNPAASVYTGTNDQGGHGNEISSGYLYNGNETFDVSNDHSVVSGVGRFTCPVDGKYRVSFFSNISVDGLTGNTFNIKTHKNGATVHLHYDQKDVSSWQYMTFSDLIDCSANDYLQIQLNAGNGSSDGTIGVDGSNAQWNSTFYELVA